MSLDRRAVLAAFIRSQANLTDTKPPTSGPGCVQLNHEEALLAAEALESCTTAAGATLEQVERHHIESTLATCGGDKRTCAQLLGISLKTLYNKLHTYGAM